MAYALFITCLADTLSPQVGRATVRVLERAGVELEFPREQTCCGQMHFNAGHVDEARTLARRFVEIFDRYEAIVTPSGSCAAHVRTHIPKLVARRSRSAGPDAGALGVPGRAGPVDFGSSFRGSLVYHPTCHSLRLLRVGDRPLSLLRAVTGVEVVELPDAEECCGFGGTFAVKNADVSSAMLDAKLDSILASGADAVAPATHRACCTSAAGCAAGARTCGRSISRRCWRRDAGRTGSATGAVPAGGAGGAGERADAGERAPRDDDDSREAGAGGRGVAGLGGAS